MKKLLVGLLFGLTSLLPALAQTTVTATAITDPSSTVWANGQCSANYQPIPNFPGALVNTLTGQAISPLSVSCTLDGSGNMSINLIPTANVVGPRNKVSPGVVFTVCPSFKASSCYSTAPIVITGSSQSVTTQINAVIQAPIINGLSPLAQAYNDAEVTNFAGNMYQRVTDGTLRCNVSGTWGACSSGGGPPTGSAGGDLSGTYPNPGVAQINGAAVPASAAFLSSNSSRQLAAAAYTPAHSGANSDILSLTGLTTPLSVGQGGVGTGTAPSSAQIPIGNSGGTAYAPHGITQDLSLSNAGVATVLGINAVPLCNSFTPTNGQNLQYTTASTPNPCYTSAAATSSFQYSALPAPPSMGSFTWVNQGSATATNASNVTFVTIPYTSTNNWRFFEQSTPSTPWSVQAYWSAQQNITTGASATTYPACQTTSTLGLYLYDGTKLEGIEALCGGAGVNQGGLRVERITNDTTDGSTVMGAQLNFWPMIQHGIYTRWCDSGTTLYAEYSMDGVNWIQIYSESVGTFITPTAAGFGGLTASTSTLTQYGDLMGWQVTSSATCP